MKNLLLRAFLFLILLASAAAIPARAQDFSAIDIYAGFSYANVGLGPQANLFGPVSKNYFGGQFRLNYNPHKNISIVLLDLGIQTRGTKIPPYIPHSENSLITTQVLFGPQFTARSSRAEVFAHTLIGVANTRLVETKNLDSIDVVSKTNLAFGLGGGLDYNVSRRFAVRLFQADYIPTRLGGTWQHEYRVSAGVVFRLY